MSPGRGRGRWLLVLRAARWLFTEGRKRLANLTARERGELADILRKSRGRPGNLSDRERRRLRELVVKAARGR